MFPLCLSQLAKVCVVAKDLVEDCEGLLGDSTSEVVRHADHLLAQAQQYMRSEQDTNPATNDCIEADFSREEELLQLVKGLGQLYTGENEELVTLLLPPCFLFRLSPRVIK